MQPQPTAKESAIKAQTPPPRKKKRGRAVSSILAVVAVAIAVAFLAGSALFIYQESSASGLPLLSPDGPVSSLLSGGSEASSRQGFAHQNGPCTSCHGSVNGQAKLYLAINGTDVTDNPTVTVKAGEAFELAYHFEGMLGGGNHNGVGIEIIAPGTSSWSVGPGTGKAAQGWTEAGSGRTFWSPAWNRAAAGASTRGGMWKRVSGQAGAFYLDYSGTPWAVSGVSAAASDNGGSSDADGHADAMGGDALVSVPLNGKPGKYELDVAAIGNDGRGNPAQLMRRVTVQVDPAPGRAGTTKKVPFKPAHGGNMACGACHVAINKAPANHVGQTNQNCLQCHTTTVSAPLGPGAPAIPHNIDGRADCLSCHNQAGLVPTPADHGGRPNSICTLCHQPGGQQQKQPASQQQNQPATAAQIPHPLDGRSDCATCHTSALIPAIPADHQQRPNEMCAVCHVRSDTASTPGAPDMPHAKAGREDCLGCHANGFLTPVPASHGNLGGTPCQSCHKAQPEVDVAGRAPNTPHSIQGRDDCLVCHGPSGMRPEPADHAGRPVAACAGCHTSNVDHSGAAPKIPHTVAGRENCMTCHSNYFVPPVPGDHKGRTNESCASCHKEPSPAAG